MSTSIQTRALIHLEAFLERAHPGFADDARLHEEARALSHAYTTGEGAPHSGDAAASLAYLAHFGPRAIAAVGHALSFTRPQRGARAIDIGAGSGASALVLAMHGCTHLVLVDASAKALATARRLLDGTGAVVDVHARDARGFVDKKAQLVLSAFAFGEIGGQPLEALRSLAASAPNARALVVVDAGDRVRARRLQTARDALVLEAGESGSMATQLHLRAPCAHLEPCPALVRERDWCHARIDKGLDVTGTDKLARFARAVGRDDERMSASFLVLDDGPPITADGARLVVIGDALKEKGRARLPVCGPAGLRYVQALKRDRAAFDALLAVPRGAYLPLDVAREVREGTAHIEDGDVASLREANPRSAR